MALETRTIENLEILRTGNWNGLEWTEHDMDVVVENFNNGIAKIPLKVTKDGTHDGQPLLLPGGAALGFVDKLKRVGDRLVASVKNVPKLVAELVANVGGVGAIPTPSVEGWDNFETADGVKHGRTLDGVILFGVHLPAVHGLEGLASLYQSRAQSCARFACVADISAESKPVTAPSLSVETRDGMETKPVPVSGVVAATSDKQNEKPAQKGQKKVGDETKIELTREEHKALYEASLRVSSVEKELAREKDRAEKAETSRIEFQKKSEEAEKLLAEYRAKDARIENEKVAASVEEQVKAGRLEPGKKESVIKYTLSLGSEERVAYLKTLENLPTMFGEVAKVPAGTPPTGNEFDVLHTKAIALQKQTGMSYEEAWSTIMSGMEA